jgi:hypothetical protein
VPVGLKLKRQKKPVAYYHNSLAARRLILSGDIEENPGPTPERNTTSKPVAQGTKIKTKCPTCTKTVQSNHKRFLCTVCFDLYHVKCTNLMGSHWKNVRADKPQDWLCNKCQLSTLPFFNCELPCAETDNNLANNSLEYLTNVHLEALLSRPKQLKLMHLNTQSMVSTFGELLINIRE